MESKKYPIGGYAPGNYTCKCYICKQEFQGDKRSVQCESCAVKALRELLKPYEQPGPRWVKASERLPMHKAFWLIEEGFKKDCSFPVRVDGKNYGMGEVFSDAEDCKSKFYFVIKGHSKDYYEDEFHRIEWLDEQPNSSPVCEPDFIEFVKNERNEISKEMLSDEWWLEIPAAKRVKFENVLIAYDQMVERLKKSQPAAGREDDVVAFAEELWDNHSVLIGEDIFTLEQYANREVMKKDDFMKAIAAFKQQHNP